MLGGTLEYLMSSLPNLSFQDTDETKEHVHLLLQKYAGGDTGQISLAEMLDSEAKKFLPASVFQIFRKISLSNIHEAEFRKSKNKLLSAFSAFTYELKEEIKAWRTAKDDSEKKPVRDGIKKILGDGTPLEKEIQIMKYQWDKLEELSAGHFSDQEALFAYKIKLMILLRWWSFNKQKGFNTFIQMTTTH